MMHLEKLKIPFLSERNNKHFMSPVLILVVSCLALVLTGCANNIHHVEVGAVPDDYRTRHPIMIKEREKTLELPIGEQSTRLSFAVGDTIRGFAQNYLKSSSTRMIIMKPVGLQNNAVVNDYLQDIKKQLLAAEVPASQLKMTSYNAYDDDAPIRLVYSAIFASTDECGQWREDMLANNSQNRNYKNFGCATQQNLAAQIVNPMDMVHPRGMSQVDAKRRATAIGKYQTNGAGL